MKAQERKKIFDESTYFYKATLLEQHEMRQVLKKEIEEQFILREKSNYFQKAWIKLLTIIFIAQEIKIRKEVKKNHYRLLNFFKVRIKKKVQEAYLGQIRKKAINKLLAFNRMIGANPNERVMIEINLILNVNVSRKLEMLTDKSEIIIFDFLSKISTLFDLDGKVEKVQAKSFTSQ